MADGQMPWEMDWQAGPKSAPAADASTAPWEMDWSPKKPSEPQGDTAETSSPYANDMPLPGPPSMLEKIENAAAPWLKNVAQAKETAAAKPGEGATAGLGGGIGPLSTLGDFPEMKAAAQKIGLMPTDKNLNILNATTGFLTQLGFDAADLTGRLFSAVIHGGAAQGAQILKSAGMEPQQADDLARDVGGGIEIDATRGGEIPALRAVTNAAEFSPRMMVNREGVEVPPVSRSRPSPQPSGPPVIANDVMASGSLDEAIQKAQAASETEPYDIEAEAAKAEAAARQAEAAAPAPGAAPAAEQTTPAPGLAPGTDNIEQQIQAAGKPAEPASAALMPETTAQAADDGIPLSTLASAARDVRDWNAAPPKGISLFQQIRSMGGIKVRKANGDYTPEGTVIAQILDKDGGLYRSLVNNARGKTPDYLREALKEGGWFGGQGGDELNDLYDLIDRESRGEPVYHPDSETAQALEARRNLDEEMNAAGVGANDKPEDQVRALAQFRHERDIEAQRADQLDALKARAAQLGVPYHGGMTYDELLGDVAEREAIQAESNDATADDIEQRTGDSLARREAQAGAGAVGKTAAQPDEFGIPGWDFEPVPGERAGESGAGTEGGGDAAQTPAGTGPKFALAANSESDVAPPFFSALTRAVESSRQERAAPGQWLATIRNTPGVKADEMDWSGVEQWLNSQAKSVSKADLLDYLRAHEVDVQEIAKGGTPLSDSERTELETLRSREQHSPGRMYENDWRRLEELEDKQATASGGQTKFGSYVLPGGQNYRELLLKLPDPSWMYPGRKDAPSAEAGAKVFRSSHWDEPNVLAHVRFDDRTGPNGEKILHVAEFQSDWHQRGRKVGYKGGAPKLRELFLPEELTIQETEHQWIGTTPDGHSAPVGKGVEHTEAGAREYLARHLNGKAQEANFKAREAEASKVPNAPFKTTWQELAAKRMLRYAAEHGYDRLSWDTGETNAARYDLSKHVERVIATKQGPNRFTLDVRDKSGATVLHRTVDAGEMPELIGKDLADKIAEQRDATKAYTGLDLKVGGEGMRGFYDKILPAFMNRYAKTWGARVEDYRFDMPRHTYVENRGDVASQTALGIKPVHSVPVTSAMRDSVMRGQPMFARSSKPDQPRLNSEDTVPVLDVPKRFNPAASFKEERLKVQQWARANIRGTYRNRATGWDIALDGGGIKEATSLTRSGRDMDVVRSLPRLLEDAVHTETNPPAKAEQDVRAYHTMQAAISYDGKPYRVQLTIREQPNGRRFYDQHSVEMEQAPAGIGGVAGEPVARSAPAPEPTVKLGDLLRGVKYRDGTPIFQEEGPKAAAGWTTAEAGNDLLPILRKAGAVETPEGTHLLFQPEFEARRAEVAATLKRELEARGLGRIGIRVADMIANSKGKFANGYYFQKLITVALKSSDEHLGLLDHELIHALRDMDVFTKGEWRILAAEARRKWMNDPEVARRLAEYKGLSDDAMVEEAIAFAIQLGKDARPAATTFAGRMGQRVRDVLRALKNALLFRGFKTPESIFRDIREGGFGKRLNAAESAPSDTAHYAFGTREEAERVAREDSKSFGTPYTVVQRYDREHGTYYAVQQASANKSVRPFAEEPADWESQQQRAKSTNRPAEEPGAVDASGKPLPQLVIPGAERSARQAQAARETATGRIAPKAPQKPAGGLFAEPDQQADLFGGKGPRFALRDPEEFYRDKVSELIEAVAGERGDQGRGPSVPERDIAERIAAHGLDNLTKNLNPIEESASIFPRTLATLDSLSARFWNAWTKRDAEGIANTDRLRGMISDSLVRLPAESRDRVYAAIELARKFNWRPADDGRAIRVRNTSYWQARKSKVGDDYVLSPAETRAFHDLLKVGDEGWQTVINALAKREGWNGPADPAAIRAAANARGEGLPAGKQLLRLANAIEEAQGQMKRPYFPASRFGDYFIAVRAKPGADQSSLGGRPEVEWFETVEKPALHDLLGRSRIPAKDLPAVQEAVKRIRALTKPDGSLAFPEATHAIEIGDLRTRPQLLGQLNLPQVERLFALMEHKVTDELTGKIMAEGADTNKREARAEAKEAYQRLEGEAKDQLLESIYQDLLAGFKKKASLTPGYSDDFDRAIGSHIGHISRNSADMVHRTAIDAAYQDIQENHPHYRVRDYWKQWRQYQENPREPFARATGGMAHLGAAYVMGLNPSATLMVASHTPMMAAPVLGVGAGIGPTVARLIGSLKEAYGALSFDKAKGGYIDISRLGRDPAERALLADAANSGLLHSVGSDDLQAINDRLSGLWGSLAPTMKRGLDISMSNIAAVDQANRSGILLATYRLARDPARLKAMAAPWTEHNAVFRDMVIHDGLTPESFAKFMLSEAAGSWGRLNQAPIMRGWEGNLAFALHGFQTRYLSTAFKLVKNMGPSGKVAAGLMMGALWTAGGLYALPFTQDAENAVDLGGKWLTGIDPMTDAHVRQFLSDDAGLGKMGAEAILRGPVSLALGTDLSSRIGFGDIITRSVSATDFMGTIPSIMYGRLAAMWQRYQTGQGAGAVAAEALPSALRSPVRAGIESQTGRLSEKGTMLQTPDRISVADTARRAIGLQPLSQEQAATRAEDIRRSGEQFTELRQRTVRNVVGLMLQEEAAAKAGNAREAAELSAAQSRILSEYNQAYWQQPVTSQELKDAILQSVNPELYQKLRLPRTIRGQVQERPYP